MVEYARIGPVFRDDVGDDLFVPLAEIYPEGQTGKIGHTFEARLPLADKRTQQILRFLEDSGFIPWSDHSKPYAEKANFNLVCERVYDSGDWSCCSYLELRPPEESHFFDSPRRDDALIRLLSAYLLENVDIGFTMPTWFVVPSRVNRLLVASNLKGIAIRPTLLLEGTYADAGAQPIPWERYGEPWWELDAEFTMPPMSDSMTFTDMNGKVLKERDFSNGFHRREGLQLYPEIHYRASALANLPPFDLARTYEPFGNRKGYDRGDCPLVASNRFYKFCVEQGIKTNWIPVRVDPA